MHLLYTWLGICLSEHDIRSAWAHKIILPLLSIIVSSSLVLLAFLFDDCHVVYVYDL
jgi:hypothetical protein